MITALATASGQFEELYEMVRQFNPRGRGLTVSDARVTERMEREAPKHEFVFARLAYTYCEMYGGGYYKNWSTDFPKADRQLIMGLKRLMGLDAYDGERPVRLGHNELREFPFIYIVEPGYMCLRQEDVLELRGYLQAGGFLFIDDFWGSEEWDHVQGQLRQILPDALIVELSIDHPIFHQMLPVDEIIQVPNVGQGMQGGPTHEADGYVPFVHGMFDDDGRLVAVIFRNTDLADAWEWAENPYFPLKYSNYAYRMALNVIVYAMSH